MGEKSVVLDLVKGEETISFLSVTSASRVLIRMAFGMFFVSLPRPKLSRREWSDLSKDLTSIFALRKVNPVPALGLGQPGGDYVFVLGKKVRLTPSDAPLKEMQSLLSQALKNNLDRLIEAKIKSLDLCINYQVKITHSVGYIGQLKHKRGDKKNYIIGFNLFLGMFDLRIIDSVVAHELSHVLFENHRKCFYEQVLALCPNYYYLSDCLNRGYVNGLRGELA